MGRPKSPPSGGRIVAETLESEGVHTLFTLIGGHVSPILVEAKALGIRVIDVRDEKNAAFAADALGRLEGRPGVAVVTAGPGVTNTLTALTNARLAQTPLVVLGGAAATLLQGRGALQDIDQLAVVRPHVKLCLKVTKVAGLQRALTRAFAAAREGVPGPVFVECPIDALYPEALIRDFYAASTPQAPKTTVQSALRWYIIRHVERLFDRTEPPPPPGFPFALPAVPSPLPLAIGRTQRMIEAAERPVLLVGSQAVVGASAREVAAAVSDLDIPTYLAGMARGLLGRTHEILLRHRRREALKDADLVILAGVPTDFRLDYGRAISSRARLVHIDLEPAATWANRVPQLPIPAHPGTFLVRLAHAVGERTGRHRAWLDVCRARDDEREAEIDALAAEPAAPVNPIALCRAMNRHLAEDALIVADGGDFVATAAYTVHARGPLSWLDPGPFGTLGVGAGFALAAALAHPNRETWLLYGDGAAGFSLVEFDTFVRHRLPVIAVVGNDAGWSQIERDQVELLGDDVGCKLAFTRYDEVARGYGAEGLHLTDINRADETFREAKRLRAEGKAVLVNVELGKTAFRRGSISI